ncbi:RNA polymerase sigma factor [Streptomyces sp. NPDC059101]|uniref:RNA polymerase sigma factor n=1 Tax=Streptomyces sp. NPDC059101 TaxID=3346728 RepID=UPI0036A8C34D
MVGDGLSGEAVVLGGEVVRQLLDCYRDFMEREPSALQREFRTLSPAACQDIAQEAFLRVGSKAKDGGLAAETNVRAYLHRAARNLAVDHCRAQQRGAKRLRLLANDVVNVVPEQPALPDEDRVLQELVIPAIEEMPEDLRRKVVDLQSRGLSDAEIANTLGIPAHRLHNLRNKTLLSFRF